MNKKLIVIGALVLCWGRIQAADSFIQKVTEQILPSTDIKLFTTVADERKKAVEAAQEHLTKLEQEATELDRRMHAEEDIRTTDVQMIKDKLRDESADTEFLNEKLSLYNELSQVLRSVQEAHKALSIILREYIKEVRDYLEDADFKKYRAGFIEEHVIYTLEYLDKLNQLVIKLGDTRRVLDEQEKNAQGELENRKKTGTLTTEGYKRVKDEQAELAKKNNIKEQGFGLTTKQKLELLAIREKIYSYKKKLNDLLLRHIEYKVLIVRHNMFVNKARLETVQQEYARVKPLVRVSEADAEQARDQLKESKERVAQNIKKYDLEIKKIEEKIQSKKNAPESPSKKHSLEVSDAIEEWSFEPLQTVASYVALVEVGSAHEQILALARKKDLLETMIALEIQRLEDEQIQVDVKASFAKVTARKLLSEEQVGHEIDSFSVKDTTLNASNASFKYKKTAAAKLLISRKKALENLVHRKQELNNQRDVIFKASYKEFDRCVDLLARAEKMLNEQITSLNKTLSMYDDSINVIDRSSQRIKLILTELNAKKFWQRSKDAITWDGVKKIFPDVRQFLLNVLSYLTDFNLGTLLYRMRVLFEEPSRLLYTTLFIVLWLLALLLLRIYLPFMRRMILLLGARYQPLRPLCLLTGALLSFGITWFVGIFGWLSLLMMLRLLMLLDPYPYVIFYLISIPYWLYLAHACIRHIVFVNESHNYGIIPQEYQQRLIAVCYTFIDATIIITLFRQAFTLVLYTKSEVPTILLALNFIVLQIALTFLFSKEQILGMMPERVGVWSWIRDKINRYYYIILAVILTIIVMSNPYVGYGRHVYHFLYGVFATVILIKLFVWTHTAAKRTISHIFFDASGDLLKERFPNAKTWFGLFLIMFFMLLSFFGFVIIANIWGDLWGFKIAWRDITAWFHEPIMLRGTEQPLSVLSLFQISMFIVGGFCISFLINRFVLDKIFDLLLVDVGAQNTVLSITHYVIVVLFVAFGFQSVGLGAQVGYVIGILILSLGWVLKDPISDFVAYFIILMQRPLKIGDYIRIDDTTMGVVRKITSRAVVLRRKNSVTIVVPNSEIIKHNVVNWNYTHGFIAFDDIMIRIHYKEDPARVRDIFINTLDESTVVLKNPKPIVRLEEFGDYGYVFLIRGYISSSYTLRQWDIASDIRLAIIRKLRQEKIEIALPARVIMSSDRDVLRSAEDRPRQQDERTEV